MSGLLERIARRRRASSEGRHSLSGDARGALAHGSDATAGSVPHQNGSAGNGSGALSPSVFMPPTTDLDARADFEATVEFEAAARDEPEVIASPAPVPAFVAERAAAHDRSDVPTSPPEAADPDDAAHPDAGSRDERRRLDFRARGRLRRRARYLRRLREIQLRDIGGLVLELQRFGRNRPELVAAKLEAASLTAEELRALEQALGEGHAIRELREPGIGGACLTCGAVYGSSDRFCASCGRLLDGRPDDAATEPRLGADEPAPPAARPAPPPAESAPPASEPAQADTEADTEPHADPAP